MSRHWAALALLLAVIALAAWGAHALCGRHPDCPCRPAPCRPRAEKCSCCSRCPCDGVREPGGCRCGPFARCSYYCHCWRAP